MRREQKSIKGFTLIELLVVSTIIVVLSAIGLVSFANSGRSSRDAKRKADLESVRQALVLYRSDNGAYPTGFDYAGVIGVLAPTYISLPTPDDPKAPTVSYEYSDAGGGLTFCLCAGMENADNAAASGCGSGLTNAYCVTNP